MSFFFLFLYHTLKALKKIGETDVMSAKAKRAMDDGKLEEAQKLYCEYLVALDKYLVPPYQVICHISVN